MTVSSCSQHQIILKVAVAVAIALAVRSDRPKLLARLARIAIDFLLNINLD